MYMYTCTWKCTLYMYIKARDCGSSPCSAFFFEISCLPWVPPLPCFDLCTYMRPSSQGWAPECHYHFVFVLIVQFVASGFLSFFLFLCDYLSYIVCYTHVFSCTCDSSTTGMILRNLHGSHLRAWQHSAVEWVWQWWIVNCMHLVDMMVHLDCILLNALTQRSVWRPVSNVYVHVHMYEMYNSHAFV